MVRSLSQPPEPAPAHHPHAPDWPDDAALLAAARADPEAFALVYQRYVAVIYRYCHVQLGSGPAAEDATSEVFLRALAGLRGFRGGSVAAWLFKIARNAVIDTSRRRRLQPLDAIGELVDPALSPEAAAEAAAERAVLREALSALPDDQRAAVWLQLAGWSGEQIASALGRSPAAVYMLRARALARLSKALRRAGWFPEEVHDARA